MCYALRVHEYFVTLHYSKSVTKYSCTQSSMSTLLSYYGGECVLMHSECMSTLFSYYSKITKLLHAPVQQYFVILLWWRVCVMHSGA